MLPKQYRLKKRIAFTATYKLGNTCHKDGITVFCGKKSETETTKVGFVVSKKIHKRAVKRNRIKRLMRESVRLYIKENNGLSSNYLSLIFVASSKLLTKDFSEVDTAIKKIMRKIND